MFLEFFLTFELSNFLLLVGLFLDGFIHNPTYYGSKDSIRSEDLHCICIQGRRQKGKILLRLRGFASMSAEIWEEMWTVEGAPIRTPPLILTENLFHLKLI